MVGFGLMEVGSVMYDERFNPIGVLGVFQDPASTNGDVSAFMESGIDYSMPLLGIITGERVNELIANPPRKGTIDRAWLGITLQALTEDIAEFLGINAEGGIIVNNIVPGSPADLCGLEVGDVIHEIAGQPVQVSREEELPVFQRAISQMGAGTSVEFAVYRPSDDKIDTLTMTAVLQAAPIAAADAADYEDEDLEFKVRDLVFADFMNFNVQQGEIEGAVVSELQRGGPANVAGLRLLDVIQRCEQHPDHHSRRVLGRDVGDSRTAPLGVGPVRLAFRYDHVCECQNRVVIPVLPPRWWLQSSPGHYPCPERQLHTLSNRTTRRRFLRHQTSRY